MTSFWKTVLMADVGVWVDPSRKLFVKCRRSEEFKKHLYYAAGMGV